MFSLILLSSCNVKRFLQVFSIQGNSTWVWLGSCLVLLYCAAAPGLDNTIITYVSVSQHWRQIVVLLHFISHRHFWICSSQEQGENKQTKISVLKWDSFSLLIFADALVKQRTMHTGRWSAVFPSTLKNMWIDLAVRSVRFGMK